MRIYITSKIDTAMANWPRRQNQELDNILGRLDIKDFGIDEGEPWLEMPDGDIPKIDGKLSFEARNYLYLHIVLSGGDGRSDPIGLANDGIETISVIATLRQGIEPDAAVLTGISNSFRIKLRHEDGSEYTTLGVQMADGVISFDYKTSNPQTGLVRILSRDMDSVFTLGEQDYRLKLIGDTEFKVYEKMGDLS